MAGDSLLVRNGWRKCVYIEAEVQQGEILLDIDREAKVTRYGAFTFSDCLKGAGLTIASLKEQYPIASEGKTVAADELLRKSKDNPDEWHTATATVTGTVQTNSTQKNQRRNQV